ncbi:hypothetical protein AGABI1DRAFT_45716, partial [Agaricus bisporus var. burnettii JB137-S8]
MSHNTPPIFADIDKFDGTNWVAWRGLIEIAAELRGVSGYLEGTITQPLSTSPSIVLSPPATQSTATTSQGTIETAWDSSLPSQAEWKTRNAWTKGLLVYNTKDPIGLGIVLSGTAAEAWKSYTDQ